MAAAIRPATAQDAALLAPLCAEHAAYERIAGCGAGHAGRLAAALAQGRLRAWLALSDGEPVGYASATVDFATLAGAPFLHLDCLYLRESVRGLGLGRALLAAVAEHGRAQGYAELQWQTPAWNRSAIGFYRRLGGQMRAKARFSLALV
ncbi:GNAT family N-acetyltransferase [Chitinimonas koreensis]|nr:GNAT family N-acetyltransferase [Chitinimonas koreensis]